MRVAWVHPSWRDLVIEHLSEDGAARRRFLRGCSIHGTLLALSTAGGEAGARQLPLLKNDSDWDAVTARVHELAPGLEQAELIGLLDGAVHTVRELKSNAAEPEVEALARALLARVSGLWKATHTPIALPELEAWLGVARLLSPRPSPPSIAVTWAELLPVTASDISDYRSLERFADWLTLAGLLLDYDPELLHQLGFPGHSQRLIVAFCNALARDDAGQRIHGTDHAKRALARIPRLFPPLADRADHTLYWLDDHARERPTDYSPPWTSTPPGSHNQRSGQLDIQRVLRDL